MSVFVIVVPVWSTKKRIWVLVSHLPQSYSPVEKKKKKIQNVDLFISPASLLSVESRGGDNRHVHV